MKEMAFFDHYKRRKKGRRKKGLQLTLLLLSSLGFAAESQKDYFSTNPLSSVS